MPVIIEDKEVELAKFGGHYYRVTAWDKARPGLPTVPDCSKAVWRKHNLLDDVVETTEPIVGVVALDIEKEGIPANGIGNWTVADFKGVQRDEEAYKPFRLNAHLVKNHCVGVLTYDEFHALKFYTEREKASPSLLKLQAAADLKAIAQVMPWGEAFKDGAPVLSLDGALLTTAKIAAAWQSIIPAPVPKCLEKCVEAAFEVALEDRKVPLGTVEEEKAADLFAESRGVKVSGWSPTNAYVGTIQITQTGGSTSYKLGVDAGRIKLGQSFTTVGAFTLASISFNTSIKVLTGGAGSVVVKLYTGDTCGAGSLLATWEISVAEIPTTGASANYFLGGSGVALNAATAYNITIEGTGSPDASNYIQFQANSTGGLADGQAWGYNGATWAAITGYDLKINLYDNSSATGKFVVRADCDMSDFANIKGAAVATTDTYTVTMGATLTRSTGVTCLQGRQGDTVTTTAPVYATQVATYRYGYEVVNAGVTVSWQGVVGGVGAGSGYIQTPMTADTSSKSCRLTFNGTAANPVVITNAGDTPNVNQRWIFSLTYGGITSGSNYLVTRCSSAYSNPIFLMVNSSAKTTQGNMLYEHWTCTHDALGNATFMGPSATMDLGITFSQLTLPYQIWLGNLSVTMAAGFFVRTPNLKIVCGALTYYGFGFGQNASQTIYFQNEGWYFNDARFSEATPTTFAVADAGTGGELDFTVANISAIAAEDLMVVYSSGGVELGRCSRAFYEAALYNKPANTLRLGGFVDATAYNGMYCKYTRDGILFGAASGTANGTPSKGASGVAKIVSVRG